MSARRERNWILTEMTDVFMGTRPSFKMNENCQFILEINLPTVAHLDVVRGGGLLLRGYHSATPFLFMHVCACMGVCVCLRISLFLSFQEFEVGIVIFCAKLIAIGVLAIRFQATKF